FIVIRNTFNGEIRKFRNCFMSSKGINRPGIGISSSMKIISNNSGSISITNNDSQFQVGITLPLKSET
ncbi:MAG: GHKL domain-containing protein, partial [Oscillospiraceae bacterium]|nr:GHKL domain-containing protein [Oscillospiraceae bacterium]